MKSLLNGIKTDDNQSANIVFKQLTGFSGVKTVAPYHIALIEKASTLSRLLLRLLTVYVVRSTYRGPQIKKLETQPTMPV